MCVSFLGMCKPKLQFRPMTIVTELTETFGQLLVKKGTYKPKILSSE